VMAQARRAMVEGAVKGLGRSAMAAVVTAGLAMVGATTVEAMKAVV